MKSDYNGCEECQQMHKTGVFTEKEIVDYHDGELTLQSFDKERQEIILNIFISLDAESNDYY